MQGAIVERPLARFVGLRVVSHFDELAEMVSAARKTLLGRQYEIGNIRDPYQQLGVTLPGEHESDEDSVTTYLGFEVEEYGDVPGGFARIDLAPGSYARFAYAGSLDAPEFEAFYPGIFNWFREHGLIPGTGSGWIEVYGRDYRWEDRGNPENRLEVLIPIARGPN